uniref:Receptor ligand binding region domain-containing protein n=1 Tax=Lactuca sativa TaxID=4236 RepID=A0A9R1VRR6_LACSA|nr:hypothetical protein LSAT_V11C400196710 [Lactuca sativa]
MDSASQRGDLASQFGFSRHLDTLELGELHGNSTSQWGFSRLLEFSKDSMNSNLLGIARDETSQFKGIVAVIDSFKAKNVIVICEDTSYEELHKLQTMQDTMFIVHTPPSLASDLFSIAKDLGMMGEGYMWIVTSKTMDLLDSMDDEFKEVDSNGIWAYDAIHALAMAVKRVQTREFALKDLGTNIGTSLLLDKMLRVTFHSLGGEFKLMNGRIISNFMEVVNVIGKGDRRVGFWMRAIGGGFVKEIKKPKSSSNQGLEIII